MKHCLEASSPNRFQGKIKPTRKKKNTHKSKKKYHHEKPNKLKGPEKCEESVQTYSLREGEGGGKMPEFNINRMKDADIALSTQDTSETQKKK